MPSNPEPTQPLTDEELAQIRARSSRAEVYGRAGSSSAAYVDNIRDAALDVPRLLAEVDRLRTELESVTQFAESLRAERDRSVRSCGELGVELDRLRAENTALRASLDQFRSFPDNPGPGKWSVSYRMGYADAGRDVRAIVRALDQSGEGQANADR